MVAVDVILVALLIVLNGVLSMSELAIASARKARLQTRAEDGDAGAEAALELAESPNRFLSTVQIGITLIGILAGAFGGAALSDPLARLLAGLPVLGRYAHPIAVVVVVLLITYCSLVVGELAPKRIALQHPEGIAGAVARPMRTVSRVASPVVKLLGASTDAVLRLFGSRTPNEPPVTEEEIELLIRQGTQAGVFAPAEQQMVAGVFELGDRRASELMTPRHRVVFLDLDEPPEVNRRRMVESPHHAFPVCEGSLDQIVGVVRVKDLWSRSLAGEATDVRAVMMPPLFVPETLPVLTVLERFKRSGTTLAIVIDEYGGVQGILALADIMAAIAGDLEPEPASGEGRAVRRADGSWLLDGALPAHEVRRLLDVDELPGEEEGDFETLAGFLMTRLGRIPAVADQVEWDGHRFEVVDMDGYRVDKVLVAPTGTPPADAG